MEIYQRMIEKYQMDPEYVNPNCSEKQARVILARLQKEYYTSYRIDQYGNYNWKKLRFYINRRFI